MSQDWIDTGGAGSSTVDSGEESNPSPSAMPPPSTFKQSGVPSAAGVGGFDPGEKWSQDVQDLMLKELLKTGKPLDTLFEAKGSKGWAVTADILGVALKIGGIIWYAPVPKVKELIQTLQLACDAVTFHDKMEVPLGMTVAGSETGKVFANAGVQQLVDKPSSFDTPPTEDDY